MTWIVLSILFLLVIVLFARLGPLIHKYAPRGEEENYKSASRAVGWGGIAVLIVLWFLVTLTSMYHNVGTGHVGLVKNGGSIVSQRGNGWVVIAPWQSLEQVDVRSHTVCAKGDVPENGNCQSTFEPFSKDNIDVHVHGALTYHVDPEDIQFLYTKVGPNFENKVVLVMLADVVRVEFNKFGYQAIAGNRAEIDEAITKNMMARIAAHPQPGVKSIKIDAFNTLNFDFNQDVKDAINQKVLENEKANAATARLQTAKNDADAREATAKGDAKVAEAKAEGDKQAAIFRAQGEAEANRLVNESLTTNLLALRISEHQKIQWGLVQPGTSIIATLSDLFKSGGAVVPAAPAPAPAPAGR